MDKAFDKEFSKKLLQTKEYGEYGRAIDEYLKDKNESLDAIEIFHKMGKDAWQHGTELQRKAMPVIVELPTELKQQIEDNE